MQNITIAIDGFSSTGKSTLAKQLAKELGVTPESGYIDECHFCYLVRRSTIHKFKDYLAPEQVYGLD